MAAERQCFLDATVLSNFSSTGSIGWLVDLLEHPAVVPAVLDELEAGRRYGHEYLEDAIDAVGTDIELVETSEPDDDCRFRDRLDPVSPLRLTQR